MFSQPSVAAHWTRQCYVPAVHTNAALTFCGWILKEAMEHLRLEQSIKNFTVSCNIQRDPHHNSLFHKEMKVLHQNKLALIGQLYAISICLSVSQTHSLLLSFQSACIDGSVISFWVCTVGVMSCSDKHFIPYIVLYQ